MITPLFIAFVFAAAVAFAVYVIVHLRREVAAHAATSVTLRNLQERFKGVQNADAERQRVLEQLEAERVALQRELNQAERDAATERERMALALELVPTPSRPERWARQRMRR